MSLIRVVLVHMVLLISVNMCSQKELFYREVKPMEQAAQSGPNSPFFGHFYLDLGFMTDCLTNEDNRLAWSSHKFHLGYRQKIRITRKTSFLLDLAPRVSIFRPKSAYYIQGMGKYESHTEQVLFQTGFYGGLFCRFNVGKTGNHLGTFVDIGVFGNSNFYSRLRQEFEGEQDHVSVYHWTDSDSPLNSYSYGFKVRSGFDWVSFWLEYRQSPLFVAKHSQGLVYYNFAPFTIGVEVKVF